MQNELPSGGGGLSYGLVTYSSMSLLYFCHFGVTRRSQITCVAVKADFISLCCYEFSNILHKEWIKKGLKV